MRTSNNAIWDNADGRAYAITIREHDFFNFIVPPKIFQISNGTNCVLNISITKDGQLQITRE
jgi:hypothetical protein